MIASRISQVILPDQVLGKVVNLLIEKAIPINKQLSSLQILHVTEYNKLELIFGYPDEESMSQSQKFALKEEVIQLYSLISSMSVSPLIRIYRELYTIVPFKESARFVTKLYFSVNSQSGNELMLKNSIEVLPNLFSKICCVGAILIFDSEKISTFDVLICWEKEEDHLSFLKKEFFVIISSLKNFISGMPSIETSRSKHVWSK